MDLDRLHIFVTLIFLITLLFVSLGWYHRDKTHKEDLSNLNIFLDPRDRVLTLSDNHAGVRGGGGGMVGGGGRMLVLIMIMTMMMTMMRTVIMLRRRRRRIVMTRTILMTFIT